MVEIVTEVLAELSLKVTLSPAAKAVFVKIGLFVRLGPASTAWPNPSTTANTDRQDALLVGRRSVRQFLIFAAGAGHQEVAQEAVKVTFKEPTIGRFVTSGH